MSSYKPASESKERTGEIPNPRYLDSTFYCKISKTDYHNWDSMQVSYSRENYAATATIRFPRYTMGEDGKRKYTFVEKAYIRSAQNILGPRNRPVVEVYFAGEMMFKGVLDSMDFELNGPANEYVSVSCRDLMGELAVDPMPPGYHVPNGTPESVVEAYIKEILGPYGVTFVTDGQTAKKVGAFADSNYRFIPGNATRLDIIVQMAAFAGKVFYIRGDKFYFVAPKKASQFPTFDITYEYDTNNVKITKNWASENLIVEGRTKPTKNSKGKKLNAKSQMVVERIGNGNIIVRIPTKDTMSYGEGRGKEEAREMLRAHCQAVYKKMTERILGGNISELAGRIDWREFDFKVRLLNVGIGLSQHYLPLDITHNVTKEGTYKIDLHVINVPEGAEEAIEGGTFAPGEFTAESEED